jgi:transcriptional regulator with XRE-family HTH domain
MSLLLAFGAFKQSYSNSKLLHKLISSVKLLPESVCSCGMETTNEKLRQQFSERLKKELMRMGVPISSPTHIANEFNGRYPAAKVTAQTVRKWLLADAIPTQARLVGLADWLGVSPQWLRFGTGSRKTAKSDEPMPAEASAHAGVILVGPDQAALMPVVELLTRLSPANVRLVENIVRCVLAEQSSKRS